MLGYRIKLSQKLTNAKETKPAGSVIVIPGDQLEWYRKNDLVADVIEEIPDSEPPKADGELADELEKLTKQELVDRAKELGLRLTGVDRLTKKELIVVIEEALIGQDGEDSGEGGE
jgi:hypothetical protein